MRDLLAFIEAHAFEPELFLLIPSARGESYFEVLWQRDEGWTYRERGVDTEWQHSPSESLIQHLRARGADIRNLQEQLVQVGTSELRRAHRVARDGRRLFGRFRVNMAATEMAAPEGLVAPVDSSMVADVVEGGREVTPPRRGHLRLV